MKKIILATTTLIMTLSADVTTIVPYGGLINYSGNEDESFKDKGSMYGSYLSRGNLNYLFELDYAHTQITYKDSSLDDLIQDDITMAYSLYYEHYMFKLGYHHIFTTDIQLGDANVIIASIGGYQFVGYDKYSYGIEGYYSLFNEGEDEEGVSQAIHIFQASPYFSFYKSLSIHLGNTFLIKGNYQRANNYVKSNYLSYEVSDTLFYKKIFTTIKAYGGQMRSGTKDGGFTIFNTLDLMKQGYGVKLGYSITLNTTVSLNYDVNHYTEHGKSVDTSNDILLTNIRYSF